MRTGIWARLRVGAGLVCLWGISTATAVWAVAPAMTRADYVAARDKVQSRTDKALTHCKTLADAKQRRCILQAEGEQKIDVAALVARHHPSANNRFKALAAEVDLGYALDVDHCKSSNAGWDKDAKAALHTCLTKAKQQRAEGMLNAHQQAASHASVGTPPKSEAEMQRDADLDTAIRKCDSLLGDANLQCMSALSPEAQQRAADRANGTARSN